MNSKKIAVIGAMDSEISNLRELLTNSQSVECAGFSVYTGTISGHFIVLAKSGIGKVNAAINTQFIIDKYNPDIIINTGVAGGLGNNVKIGDIVVGTTLVQHDFDVSALGYVRGHMCTGNAPDKPTEYRSDENLVQKLETIIDKSKFHKGVIASGDIFVSDMNTKQEINRLFSAIAIEMEGAAIAQTASINKIPFVIVRTISDNADGNPDEFKQFVKEMAETSALTIHKLLKII